MNSLSETVISNIKKALKENNMSQAELGRRIHSARSTVTHWLDGTNGIRQDKLEEIAKVLHHDISWFFIDENEKHVKQQKLNHNQILLAMSLDSDATKEEVDEAIRYVKYMHAKRLESNEHTGEN